MSLNEKKLENLDMGLSGHTNTLATEHSHDECEIYLLTAGNCTYLINNKMYTIKKGDLVVIPEHTLHRTMYDPQDVHVRMLCSIPVELIPHNLYSLISKKNYVYRLNDKFEMLLSILNEINANYSHYFGTFPFWNHDAYQHKTHKDHIQNIQRPFLPF